MKEDKIATAGISGEDDILEDVSLKMNKLEENNKIQLESNKLEDTNKPDTNKKKNKKHVQFYGDTNEDGISKFENIIIFNSTNTPICVRYTPVVTLNRYIKPNSDKIQSLDNKIKIQPSYRKAHLEKYDIYPRFTYNDDDTLNTTKLVYDKKQISNNIIIPTIGPIDNDNSIISTYNSFNSPTQQSQMIGNQQDDIPLNLDIIKKELSPNIKVISDTVKSYLSKSSVFTEMDRYEDKDSHTVGRVSYNNDRVSYTSDRVSYNDNNRVDNPCFFLKPAIETDNKKYTKSFHVNEIESNMSNYQKIGEYKKNEKEDSSSIQLCNTQAAKIPTPSSTIASITPIVTTSTPTVITSPIHTVPPMITTPQIAVTPPTPLSSPSPSPPSSLQIPLQPMALPLITPTTMRSSQQRTTDQEKEYFLSRARIVQSSLCKQLAIRLFQKPTSIIRLNSDGNNEIQYLWINKEGTLLYCSKTNPKKKRNWLLSKIFPSIPKSYELSQISRITLGSSNRREVTRLTKHMYNSWNCITIYWARVSEGNELSKEMPRQVFICNNDDHTRRIFLGLQSLVPLTRHHLTYGLFLWRRVSLKINRCAYDLVMSKKDLIYILWNKILTYKRKNSIIIIINTIIKPLKSTVTLDLPLPIYGYRYPYNYGIELYHTKECIKQLNLDNNPNITCIELAIHTKIYYNHINKDIIVIPSKLNRILKSHKRILFHCALFSTPNTPLPGSLTQKEKIMLQKLIEDIRKNYASLFTVTSINDFVSLSQSLAKSHISSIPSPPPPITTTTTTTIADVNMLTVSSSSPVNNSDKEDKDDNTKLDPITQKYIETNKSRSNTLLSSITNDTSSRDSLFQFFKKNMNTITKKESVLSPSISNINKNNSSSKKEIESSSDDTINTTNTQQLTYQDIANKLSIFLSFLYILTYPFHSGFEREFLGEIFRSINLLYELAEVEVVRDAWNSAVYGTDVIQRLISLQHILDKSETLYDTDDNDDNDDDDNDEACTNNTRNINKQE